MAILHLALLIFKEMMEWVIQYPNFPINERVERASELRSEHFLLCLPLYLTAYILIATLHGWAALSSYVNGVLKGESSIIGSLYLNLNLFISNPLLYFGSLQLVSQLSFRFLKKFRNNRASTLQEASNIFVHNLGKYSSKFIILACNSCKMVRSFCTGGSLRDVVYLADQ